MSKYTLHTDVEFSRRKRLHHVVNDQGEPVWSGATVARAFLWLAEQGAYEFRLEGNAAGETFQVMIHPD